MIMPETLALVATFEARQREAQRQPAEPDEIERQIDKAAPWLDAAPRPAGKIRPSQIWALRYVILMAHDERDHARKLVADTLAEARRRWRGGYFATPFGEPVLRPSLEEAA